MASYSGDNESETVMAVPGLTTAPSPISPEFTLPPGDISIVVAPVVAFPNGLLSLPPRAPLLP
eukprot:5768731-Lingulodinium_polyedra.AAC.1